MFGVWAVPRLTSRFSRGGVRGTATEAFCLLLFASEGRDICSVSSLLAAPAPLRGPLVGDHMPGLGCPSPSTVS